MSSVLSGIIDSLRSFGKTGFQLGKSFVIDENGNVIPQSDISGAKVGFPSQTVNQIQNIPRVTSINPNVIAGSAAVGATAIGSTIVLTNPGAQQTVQSFAPGFNSLAQGFSNVSSTLSSNPLILIALIGLGVIVILKK